MRKASSAGSISLVVLAMLCTGCTNQLPDNVDDGTDSGPAADSGESGGNAEPAYFVDDFLSESHARWNYGGCTDFISDVFFIVTTGLSLTVHILTESITQASAAS